MASQSKLTVVVILVPPPTYLNESRPTETTKATKAAAVIENQKILLLIVVAVRARFRGVTVVRASPLVMLASVPVRLPGASRQQKTSF